MRTVDMVATGKSGPYGGCGIYAPEYKLGLAYAERGDTQLVAAKLLTMCEGLAGEPLLLGKLAERFNQAPQQDLITDDRRQEPRPVFGQPKKKGKGKGGKRHTQQYTVPGQWVGDA